MVSKKEKWDEAYQEAEFSSAKAASVLTENSYLLPKGGDALDLACGRAGNAQFLAKIGFDVDAIDISTVLLDNLKKYVKHEGLAINCLQRDVEKTGLPDKRYDVIVVSYFLDRLLFSSIIQALNPNGLLFYQTWSNNAVDDSGPKNPDFRLNSGELLSLCKDLQIVHYREDGKLGDHAKGKRNEAMIIACKP